MRIPEYPVTTAPDTTDKILIDGTAGTRIIAVDDFFTNAPKAAPPVATVTINEANWTADSVGFACWVNTPNLGIDGEGDVILWDISQTATDTQAIMFLEAGIRLITIEPNRIRLKAENFRPSANIPIDVCNLFP